MSRERKVQRRGVAAYAPSRRSALAAGLAAALGGAGAAAAPVPVAIPPADVPGPLRTAIAAHRAAWAAFQGAPDASAGATQDRETEAFVALLGTQCETWAGVRALAVHLAWYIGEEGTNLAGADDPFGRIARARHADLALALGDPVPPAASPGPSPLMAAIAAHAEANAAANAAALAHSRAFDADDPAAAELLRLADEACERDDADLTVLRAVRPQDLGEAAALAEHYAGLLEEWEPNGMGEWLLYGLAAALADTA